MARHEHELTGIKVHEMRNRRNMEAEWRTLQRLQCANALQKLEKMFTYELPKGNYQISLPIAAEGRISTDRPTLTCSWTSDSLIRVIDVSLAALGECTFGTPDTHKTQSISVYAQRDELKCGKPSSDGIYSVTFPEMRGGNPITDSDFFLPVIRNTIYFASRITMRMLRTGVVYNPVNTA